MPRRFENPDVGDLVPGCIVLSDNEFEKFLRILELTFGNVQQIVEMRQVGFFAPIERNPGTDWIFKTYGLPSDLKVMAVCREDSVDRMKDFISLHLGDVSWLQVE